MKDDNAGTVWKLTLSYDGTNFHGWQIQPEKTTIQGTLAEAIFAVTGEAVLPQGSGRTDAGVHAQGQVASFPLRAAIPATNLQKALNRILPAAIRVLSAEQATPGFHARHSALGKVYQYRIFQGAICSPFLIRYVSLCKWALNLEVMQAAAEVILGEHDFTSFAALDPDRVARIADSKPPREDGSPNVENLSAPNNVRRVATSSWARESIVSFPGAPATMVPGRAASAQTSADEGEVLTYTVCGNGFLHHMVRNLVGTFVEIGRGRMSPPDMRRVLESRNRSLAGPTAAARGLCLMKVLY